MICDDKLLLTHTGVLCKSKTLADRLLGGSLLLISSWSTCSGYEVDLVSPASQLICCVSCHPNGLYIVYAHCGR